MSTTNEAPGPDRPPFDPELDAVLAMIRESGFPQTLTPELIPEVREATRAQTPPREQLLAPEGISATDVTITGHAGGRIELTVLQANDRTGTGPGIYHTHGGGSVLGDRWTGVPGLLPALRRYNAVMITVEYRLAPEHPDPTPVEDSYAGLLWFAEHAAELGLDLDRLIVAGGSAGGGLAAGLTLLARDRRGPRLHGQLLMCPMLDDRDATVSARQIDGVGLWDRGSHLTGWNALLGDRRGGDDVSIYAAPARAADLSGLPPAYIDCGSAEVFRDEDVAYATALWAAGVQAELHVWAGGFHGFDEIAPQAAVSRAAVAARADWLDRTLGR